MKKNKLLIISISSMLMLTSCNFNPIQWVKDLFHKGPAENQESEGEGEEEIPETLDLNKVADNLASMKSFKLIGINDVDFTGSMEFSNSGKELTHRVRFYQQIFIFEKGAVSLSCAVQVYRIVISLSTLPP